MAEEALNFERPEDPEAVRIGKHLWKLDVSAERIRETIAPLREAVERLKGIMMARPEREPVDYERDDDVRLIAKAFERMAEKLERIQQQNFGGVSGNGNTNKWILGIVGVLIAGGIFGLTSALFTMTDRISKVETKVDMLVNKDSK